MYPIPEYSSTYLILGYYAYLHTNTLYIYPVLWSILVYSSTYLNIHICTDSFNILYLYMMTVIIYSSLCVKVMCTVMVIW